MSDGEQFASDTPSEGHRSPSREERVRLGIVAPRDARERLWRAMGPCDWQQMQTARNPEGG